MASRIVKAFKYWDGKTKKFFLTFFLLVVDRKASGVVFREPINEEELEQMFRLRYEVYCKEYKFLDEKKFPDGKEYDNDDKRSKYVLAVDKKGEVIGCVRIIFPKKAPLPTEKEYNLDLTDRKLTAEVSRLIVKKEFRTTKVAIGLYRGIYRLCAELGYRYIIEAMEKELARWINYLFLRFIMIGKQKHFYNTYNCAYIADVYDVSDAVKNDNFLLYKYLNRNINDHLKKYE